MQIYRHLLKKSFKKICNTLGVFSGSDAELLTVEGENERQVARIGFGRLVEGVLLRMRDVYDKEG